MRSDLHEPGRGFFTSASQPTRSKVATLPAAVVDAVLSDEQTPLAPSNPMRRDIPTASGAEAARVTLDKAHPPSSASVTPESDGGLLRQLSRQLEMLEIQQGQIRRLLEQTEQRANARSDR